MPRWYGHQQWGNGWQRNGKQRKNTKPQTYSVCPSCKGWCWDKQKGAFCTECGAKWGKPPASSAGATAAAADSNNGAKPVARTALLDYLTKQFGEEHAKGVVAACEAAGTPGLLADPTASSALRESSKLLQE